MSSSMKIKSNGKNITSSFNAVKIQSILMILLRNF